MEWISMLRSDVQPRGRVLVFSPAYPENDPMRYRVIGSEFLGLVSEVTHFALLEPPTNAED